MMPSKHVHQFTCTSACSAFVNSDGAFDIHYVDANGKEISPEVALREERPPESAYGCLTRFAQVS